jgi:excinuclease ABC subunit C
MLSQQIAFDPANPAPALAALPEKPGIFALFGADPKAEPYLARTTNLRRRLKRFLDARPTQTRRLRLTERVARIEYSATGSDFESSLALYTATHEAFGEGARKRLRLRAPYFLRMTVKNRYPRVYVTNTVTKSAAACLFGPFPSRAAAERFCDEALNLFLLRRCYPDLDPDPAFPGCVYSEMKMCLAPCFQGCSDERYAEEAARVEAFLATRGASLLADLATQRDAASQELDFEKAATLHARIQKVEAVAALAPEAVRPLNQLDATLIQPSSEPGHVALFQMRSGVLTGPALYDTVGMRLHNEQSGSSSLYTHPYAVEAVPLQEPNPAPASSAKVSSHSQLEERLAEAIRNLDSARQGIKAEARMLPDHLNLFARWYYRPDAKRVGEVVFCAPDEPLALRAILRAVSRVFRATLLAAAPSGASQEAGINAPGPAPQLQE